MIRFEIFAKIGELEVGKLRSNCSKGSCKAYNWIDNAVGLGTFRPVNHSVADSKITDKNTCFCFPSF